MIFLSKWLSAPPSAGLMGQIYANKVDRCAERQGCTSSTHDGAFGTPRNQERYKYVPAINSSDSYAIEDTGDIKTD